MKEKVDELLSIECSYLSSGGDFPDGYCIWQYDNGTVTLIECCCQEGFRCETPAKKAYKKLFDGQYFKHRCVRKGKNESDQSCCGE